MKNKAYVYAKNLLNRIDLSRAIAGKLIGGCIFFCPTSSFSSKIEINQLETKSVGQNFNMKIHYPNKRSSHGPGFEGQKIRLDMYYSLRRTVALDVKYIFKISMYFKSMRSNFDASSDIFL